MCKDFSDSLLKQERKGQIFTDCTLFNTVADGHGAPYGLSLRQRKDFVIVFTGYKNTVATPVVASLPPKSPTTTTDVPETEVTNETETVTTSGAFVVSGVETNGVGVGSKASKSNASVLFTCGKEEYQCRQSDSYDDHRRHQVDSASGSSMMQKSRCIWSKLRCDYHQNCGAGHQSDETGCGYLRRVSGIHERLSPWSVSTMSLLIIVYLAIVLILVLVTMLLLRWHKVLRTPLDVLSDSRVHQSPPMVMEDRELAAAAAAASASTVTPATVSIMVMYRPHKPRGLSQPSTVELPPSYESLFMGDSPPSYNIAANDDIDPETDPEAVLVAASSVDEANVTAANAGLEQNYSVDHVAVTNADDTTLGGDAIDVDSHCECDCDHSLCINASNEEEMDFVQDK